MLAAVLVGGLFAAARQVGFGNDAGDSDATTTRIVMFGDSLTAQGNWRELFPGREVVGAGFSGYTSEQLSRLARDAVRSRPAAVFVLAGTNDVFQGQPPAWTANNLGALITAMNAESPDTQVVLQTIPPSAEVSDEVIATNDAIRRLAAARGVGLLDLHPEFDDGSGGLRDVETYDGVHLSGAGYDRWVALLEPWLDRLEAEPAS